ncbi:HIG1 domain-containing protein [Rickettsia endosymbiont of Cardiosporidium cionae]|uniref:HIG1 domain-containing protein n=1 Tax=Rickettsia endosymbiont of Cardiosporidium cionae TaxID=2777155 RepID=UPI00389AE993
MIIALVLAGLTLLSVVFGVVSILFRQNLKYSSTRLMSLRIALQLITIISIIMLYCFSS